MKKILLIVICLSFVFTGCATVEKQELDKLEKRVTVVERKQESLENRMEETVVYSSTVEVEEITPQTGSQISMTKQEIQLALSNAGYYKGPIDGKLGQLSRQAIRDFQADNGLKVDGIAGTNTQKALMPYLTK